MALLGRRSPFAPPPSRFERQLLAILSVMLASLAPLLPLIAITPSLPPFGFMVILAWRLLRNDLWPTWIALPLGLFDDLFSGQPIGSAMALWTLVFLAIDLVDTRLLWRDYWQDWGVAALAIAAEIFFAALLANTSSTTLALELLVPQMIMSILLFPLVVRLCATLDNWQAMR